MGRIKDADIYLEILNRRIEKPIRKKKKLLLKQKMQEL
jgi:hypothetical protein